MKKTAIVLGIIAGFVLTGCSGNDLKSSIIGTEPEEEMPPSTSANLDSPVEEKVEEMTSTVINDFPDVEDEVDIEPEPEAETEAETEELVETVEEAVDANEDAEEKRTPVRRESQAATKRSIEAANNEAYLKAINAIEDDFWETASLEELLAKKDELERIKNGEPPLEKPEVVDTETEENELSETETPLEEEIVEEVEEVVEEEVYSEPEEIIVAEEPLPEAYDDIFSTEPITEEENLEKLVSEAIETTDVSEEIEEENIEAEESVVVEEESEESFASSAPKCPELYRPTREDLEAFYETLQAQQKIMTEDFSFFCGSACDDLNLKTLDTTNFSVSLQGDDFSINCTKDGCKKSANTVLKETPKPEENISGNVTPTPESKQPTETPQVSTEKPVTQIEEPQPSTPTDVKPSAPKNVETPKPKPVTRRIRIKRKK